MVALLASAPVLAQAPVPLRPGASAPPPREAAPLPPVMPSVEPESPGAPLDGRVSSGRLGDLDFAEAGILGPENGGFGPDMWRGADRSLVEALLPKIPASTASPTLQKLTRRLLLSAATPPEGESGPVSLIGLRLGKLIEAGQFASAGQLAALTGGASKDDALLQARAQIALATGEFKTACDMAMAQVKGSEAIFWLKLSGFCHVQNGNEAGAQLTASLVAEQDPDDSGYQNLLNALMAKSGKLPQALPRLDIIQLAMIRFASLPLPAKIDGNASAGILKLMAEMPGAPVPQRLTAAERAEALGALSAEEVALLYAEMPFSVEDRGRAPELVKTLPAAEANALMFQSVRGQDSPASLSLALSAAWRLARASNSFATVARVNLAPVRDMIPAPEMIGIAADAGRALLAAGDPGAASRWYEMARALSLSGNNPVAASAANNLWPLLRLAQPVAVMPDNPGEISAWLAQLSPEDKQKKVPLLLPLMSALDLATPESEWIGMIAGQDKTESSAMPPLAMLHLLMEASQNGRVGQTVLLSLACLGENAAGLRDPLLLGMIVRALNSAGLRDEANALALEAALLAGI